MASWERLLCVRRNRDRVELPFAYVGEVARDRRRCGHHRAHQVGASATPLASFEIAIAGRGTAFAGSKNVGVHAQAHGAAGLAPLKTSRAENFIQSLLLGLPL